MGWPVVTVTSGGLPVTDNSTLGWGTPVEEAANGLGTPVTYVTSGGIATLGGARTTPKGLGAYVGNSPTVDGPLFDTFLGRPRRLSLAFFNQSSKANFSSSVSFICGTFTGISSVWAVPLCGAGDTLTNSAAGDYDAIWLACAQGILAALPSGEAGIVRIGWEFNLPGQPWNAITLGGTLYISAYQRCVNIFRGVSSRFKFCWNPNIGQTSDGLDVVTCYPGDTFVDFVGLDIYEQTGDSTTGQGLSLYNFRLAQDRGLTWLAGFGASHGKPVCINECGVQDDTVQVYVSSLSQWIVTNVLPSKGFFCWWDSDSSIPAKISSGERPATAALFKQYFGLPVIVNTDSTLAQNTPGSEALTSNQDSIYTMSWSIVGGAGAANFSIAGSTLSWGSLAASAQAVVVRATNSDGFFTDKTITKTFIVPHVFADPDAAAWVARRTTAASEPLKIAIDTLYQALKAAGAYSIAKEMWIAADTAEASNFGMKGVQDRTPRVSPAPVFDPFNGYLGTTSGAFVDLNLVGNASTPFVQNSAWIMIWNTIEYSGGSSAIGLNGTGTAYIKPRSGTNTLQVSINDNTGMVIAGMASAKHIISGIRSGASARRVRVDGATVGSDTQASVAAAAAHFFEDADNSFPDAFKLRFILIGSAPSDAVEAATVTALQAWATALGLS